MTTNDPERPADSPPSRLGWLARLKEWTRRYLPLEIAATLSALSGGFLAAAVTDNAVVIAFAAAWTENIGYYAIALWRELARQSARIEAAGWSRIERWRKAIGAIVYEFGLAEVIDSFVSRPFFMYAGPALLGAMGIGIIAGKIVADLVFYAIAIVFYERAKRRQR